MDPTKLRLAPRDGSKGMDPDQWLLYHRARHEQERVRMMRWRIFIVTTTIVTLALIALTHKPF